MSIATTKPTQLEWVVHKMDIGPSGYFVLFALLLSCGVGMPIPEDIPLIVAGVLIGAGHMHWELAALCAWCGIIGGDVILYILGHHFGLNITRVPFIGKHLTRTRIEKAEQLFERWGVWVVAIGRMFAGIRGAMVVAAGTIRFNFAKFVIADGLAAVISGGLFLFLGYKAGKPENLHPISLAIDRAGRWVFAFLAAGVIALIWYKRWQHRHADRTPSQIVMEKVADKTASLSAAAVAARLKNAPPKTGAPSNLPSGNP